MNVTLRQLRAFLAVARTGSFTLAAESLYISQSALSGLVKELEQSMGVRLIDRSTRRVHLTEAGERLSPMLATVLHDLDEVLHRAVDDYGDQARIVRRSTIWGEAPVSLDGRRSVPILNGVDRSQAA